MISIKKTLRFLASLILTITCSSSLTGCVPNRANVIAKKITTTRLQVFDANLMLFRKSHSDPQINHYWSCLTADCKVSLQELNPRLTPRDLKAISFAPLPFQQTKKDILSCHNYDAHLRIKITTDNKTIVIPGTVKIASNAFIIQHLLPNITATVPWTTNPDTSTLVTQQMILQVVEANNPPLKNNWFYDGQKKQQEMIGHHWRDFITFRNQDPYQYATLCPGVGRRVSLFLHDKSESNVTLRSNQQPAIMQPQTNLNIFLQRNNMEVKDAIVHHNINVLPFSPFDQTTLPIKDDKTQRAIKTAIKRANPGLTDGDVNSFQTFTATSTSITTDHKTALKFKIEVPHDPTIITGTVIARLQRTNQVIKKILDSAPTIAISGLSDHTQLNVTDLLVLKKIRAKIKNNFNLTAKDVASINFADTKDPTLPPNHAKTFIATINIGIAKLPPANVLMAITWQKNKTR